MVMEKTSLNGMKGHDRERKQVLFMKMRKKMSISLFAYLKDM